MGSSKEEKNSGVPVNHQQPQPQPQYGTFEGVANILRPYQYPHQLIIGSPQPVPRPGSTEHSDPYYPHGYQTVTGWAAAEGRSVRRERRLPYCGLGLGWFLFILGFFGGAIPWYIGLCMIMCTRVETREKQGYIACTIAAILIIPMVFCVITGHFHCVTRKNVRCGKFYAFFCIECLFS